MPVVRVFDSDSNRIIYLDIMRGLAIFFMIMQHAILVHDISSGEDVSLLSSIFLSLGTAPAAPVFLFIMGVLVCKSKKNQREIAYRGLKLFIMGYVLNIFRFYIPLLLSGNNSITDLNLIFVVDILQVAGLSLIIISILFKLLCGKFTVPFIIPIILLVSPLLWGRFSTWPLFNPIWGRGSDVIFPLFPWIVYPLLGVHLSTYLNRHISIKVQKKLIIWGIIAGVISYVTMGCFPKDDYSRYGFGACMAIISFILIWTYVVYFCVVKYRLSNSSISRLLVFWSKNVTKMYVIQWLLYGLSVICYGSNNNTDEFAIIMGFVVLAMTHLLVRINGKLMFTKYRFLND